MSNTKYVYKFDVDLGRGYEVEGLFVATPDEVDAAMGKTAQFGEICGKHSDMFVDLEASQFGAITSDPAIVAFVESTLGGGTGYNPLDYVRSVKTLQCTANARRKKNDIQKS